MSKKWCEASGWNARHLSLLHGASRMFQRSGETEGTKPRKGLSANVLSHCVEGAPISTLLQVVPVTVKSQHKSINTFALLDQGSEATLILNKMSTQLQLDGPTEMTRLGTFHGEDPAIQVKRVQFHILPRDGSRSFIVKAAYSVPQMKITKRTINWPKIKYRWQHLQEPDLPHIDSSKVTVLLGRDVLRVHDVLDTRIPPDGVEAPDGLKTHFGWCLTGPVPMSVLSSPEHGSDTKIMHIQHSQNDGELQEAVANFWLTESFGVRPLSQTILAPDEMKALRILENTVRHTGERYEVGLRLRHQDLQLPNNREVAARRFQALEKRFQRDPQYASSYSRVIEEYISLGHAKLSDTMETNNPIWYLPHHGVTKPNKPRKVRVVFNPSARHKVTNLNEHVFKGPDLLTPMIGVLLRFRRLPVPIRFTEDSRMLFPLARTSSPAHLGFRDVQRWPDER
ncbi:uncharacterized protein LOC132088564 [Daphnia carinata]|uniref:uncharacterized protein LOC132088564 n=1 Tax=Daphnia carinata TaxID=120202 RepID=UPI0028684256|nr:uncharacterized protein LOC132088564 [Daphnia carinata]